MKQSSIAVGVMLTLAMVGTVFGAKKLLANIPLVWKPTEQKKMGVVSLSGLETVKLRLAAFTDNRADKTKIGENNEDDTPKPVTTSGNVAEFCREHVARTIGGSGISVVEEGENFVLAGDVLEFMVLETDNYRGEVRLKVTLHQGDRAVWTGLVSGTNKRFGRSYKAENYYETISDSLLDAANQLVTSAEFRQKLGAK
jgi:hypothetical protein